MGVRSKRYWVLALMCLLTLTAFLPKGLANPGAGATTSITLVKYHRDGVTVLEEKNVDYSFMEENLPVLGDGETQYYHQGPIFEGDPWDLTRSLNLKNKGAVKGTAVKDLCDLVGGMSEGDEIMFVAVDGWHMKFGYTNVYDPPLEQGTIAICWFNGRDGDDGERYGSGYPGNDAYSSAMQIVFMSEVANEEGKYVFGNNDMRIALPQEEYQYFFEGEFPSTNGLSGKWISEIRIYQGGVPEDGNVVVQPSDIERERNSLAWPIVLGVLGIGFVATYFYMRRNHE